MDSTSTTNDPFDPAALRLGQDFNTDPSVQQLITRISVRKPGPQEWFRVRHEEGHRLTTTVIDLKEDREFFLVAPELRAALAGELSSVTLFTAMNRQKVLFLWPCKLPAVDGKALPWHESAIEAAQQAMKSWTRMRANMALGAYDLSIATGIVPEPEWPDLSLFEILKIAFKDHYIRSLDHPVVRRLSGEA